MASVRKSFAPATTFKRHSWIFLENLLTRIEWSVIRDPQQVLNRVLQIHNRSLRNWEITEASWKILSRCEPVISERCFDAVQGQCLQGDDCFPGDVAPERTIIREVVHEWNVIHSEDRGVVLLPVGWESHSSPAMGERPQAIINKQVLANSDLLIAAFWTRLGSPTGKAASGTVEEIEEHLSAGKPAMIYFSSAPVRPDSVDEKQYKALCKFKDECFQKGLVEAYESISEFREKLTRQLAQTVLRSFPVAEGEDQPDLTTAPPTPPAPALSEEALQLLLEASQDNDGTVMKLWSTAGLTVQTNGKNLVEDQDPRSQARWESAVKQLASEELIQDRGDKGEVFAMTEEGYKVADLLRAQQ